MTKKCKTCGLTLPTTRFLPDGRTRDKLRPSCATCIGVALDGDTEKRCKICEQVKPLAAFHRDLAGRDGLRKICKPCGVGSAKKWNKANPEKFKAHQKEWRNTHKAQQKERARKHHLLRTYSMTVEQYWLLFDAQGGVCSICGRKPRTRNLHVDHDHDCCKGPKSCGNCIRGLLCGGCNGRLLVAARNNPAILRKAAEYLESGPVTLPPDPNNLKAGN